MKVRVFLVRYSSNSIDSRLEEEGEYLVLVQAREVHRAPPMPIEFVVDND